MFFTSMTANECFQLTGTLPADRIEHLLDMEAQLEAVKGIDAHIDEAMAQYPAEDFTVGIEHRLHTLAKKLRGQNREELLGIIEAFSDLGQTTFYASDYGRSELHKAQAALKPRA